MTASGVFYPVGADNAEERLAYYASAFPVVEVDATYYALPAERTAQLWADRTPPDFTFDIKAHALMTGQGTETKRLPKAIREALPEELQAKTRIYAEGLPGRAERRGLADVPLGARAARGARPARLDPPPVPEVGVPVEREPGDDRGRRRAARRLEGRGRVPQRLVAEREEPRADARRSWPSGRSRSSWSTSRRASRAASRRRSRSPHRTSRSSGSTAATPRPGRRRTSPRPSASATSTRATSCPSGCRGSARWPPRRRKST